MGLARLGLRGVEIVILQLVSRAGTTEACCVCRLEAHFQPELHRTRAMSVDGMQEGSAGDAICSSSSFESR